MARWLLPLVLLVLRARAEACPPAVVLSGAPTAVADVGEVLVARGIELGASDCGAIEAHLEQRGDELVIDVVQPGGAIVQRVVGEAQTAATVIESFTRTDVGDPLLAIRAVPADPRPTVRAFVEEPGPTPPPLRNPRGVHLFNAFETSFASDHTRWLGAHLGACVMLGPVCAGGRLRLASVTDQPDAWADLFHRRSVELLGGIDIPLAIGPLTFSPGFAAGLGQIRTDVIDVRTLVDGEPAARMSETGGLRADVHATLSIPVWRRLALDVFTAGVLTQETHIESDVMFSGGAMLSMPDEPRLLVRFGVGLRYGDL